MIDPTARCPQWLIDRILNSGGSISFYKYMDLVLNDPENGFYSTGKLNIGKDGDFCTSPSLSNDFARLLAIQVVDWLVDMEKSGIASELFSLVEIGPGEGTLSRDLIVAIGEIAPALISKIELILVELNYLERIVKNSGEFVNETSLNPLKVKYILGFSNKSWKLVDFVSGL